MTTARGFYVCTISRTTPKNWSLCRETGLYGVPGGRRPPNVGVGDTLFFWIGGRGYVAEAVVTDDPRPPQSRAEAPWPGGTYTYGWVIPFDLKYEVRRGVPIKFDGQRQQHTQVSKAALQRSLALVSSEGAAYIRSALAARLAEEAESTTNT